MARGQKAAVDGGAGLDQLVAEIGARLGDSIGRAIAEGIAEGFRSAEGLLQGQGGAVKRGPGRPPGRPPGKKAKADGEGGEGAAASDGTKTACAVPDCGRDAVARGLCPTHYRKARRLGFKDGAFSADQLNTLAEDGRKHRFADKEG
jgi:hypothetical protein